MAIVVGIFRPQRGNNSRYGIKIGFWPGKCGEQLVDDFLLTEHGLADFGIRPAAIDLQLLDDGLRGGVE